MTDPWGDHALREHLRPLGHEPFFAVEEPEPDTEPDLAESIREGLYGYGNEPPAEPAVEGEPQPIEDPDRTEPSPDSIAGKVLTVFRTFPKEELRSTEIAATLGFEGKQVLSAIEHLRRCRQPVFSAGENKGVYYYDATKPADSTVLKKSDWYRTYRPSSKKSKTVRGTKRVAPVSTPDLLRELPLHDRAVIVYEALQRQLPDGANAIRMPTTEALSEEERELFPQKQIFSVIARYLSLIGSMQQAGPMKVLYLHPDEAEAGLRDEAQRTILAMFSTLNEKGEKKLVTSTRPIPGSALQRTEPAPQETNPDWPVTTPVPPLADDLIESVDDDRLANALANGMWTRYEWAITEVGRLNEQVLALQEGLRAREQEILRLRGYVAKHMASRDTKDIARELLTPDAD